ncbi:MAG TPA: menaquinone biosynthesis protein [Dissulfurispiraceae bacterium]|nr:menaquinone biosynthesis protein [Dissulfurispiraceae bacterium]
MTGLKLRIGRIPFANLFPIFYTLEKKFDCSSYEFVEGVPSKLNEMLREGLVDLSPSSSVEYLRNPSLYEFIDGVSVSSRGPVGSIFLFSKRPIELLDGCTIFVTSQSATSVALLEIVLSKFHGIHYSSAVSQNPESAGADAFLLIGDEALAAKSRQSGAVIVEGNKAASPYKFIYDLGEVWHEKTGLPFVFALWIVRKELYSPADARHDLFVRFVSDLMKAKEMSLGNLPEIADHSPMKKFLCKEEIIEYWNKLDYDLSEDHKKGLYLFRDWLI